SHPSDAVACLVCSTICLHAVSSDDFPSGVAAVWRHESAVCFIASFICWRALSGTLASMHLVYLSIHSSHDATPILAVSPLTSVLVSVVLAAPVGAFASVLVSVLVDPSSFLVSHATSPSPKIADRAVITIFLVMANPLPSLTDDVFEGDRRASS